MIFDELYGLCKAFIQNTDKDGNLRTQNHIFSGKAFEERH